MSIDEELEGLVELMDEVIEDRTVPRNIRGAVEDSRNNILKQGEPAVKITQALYRLDDVSNDINMPSHTRTEIWSIISELERIREQCK
jgi:uncharacterized protein (UPF0147 family)